MATSSQIRHWWRAYLCNTSKMTKVAFPTGPGLWINLRVATPSVPIWEAVSQILASEAYYFEEMIGGTYNCRPPSLHAYGLALDINPSRNPFAFPMVTDIPDEVISRIEGITANGKKAITWGGRFPDSNPPDPMHFQINVAPADCKNVQWDKGVDPDMAWTKPGDKIENIADADAVFHWQGDFAPTLNGVKQASYEPQSVSELNDRIWIVMARITDWCMRNAK